MESPSPLRVVLLSGPVGSGKSALARQLQVRYGATVIKTKTLIMDRRPRTRDERRALQRAGERLDHDEGGTWVSNGLSRQIDKASPGSVPSGLFVVDSVRTVDQIDAVRNAYGVSVHHIHLTAEPDELRRRYGDRQRPGDEHAPYEEVKRNKTERGVGNLATLSDIVVSTDRCSEGAVLVRAVALLGLYPRANVPLVDVIVGGQYGSEGKGNIAAHIAPEYDLLVRVGGPNAGHKVYAEPEPQTYHHLPSGTERAPAAKLLLGAGAVIWPQGLREEIARHEVSNVRLSIDPGAMIIEEEDKAAEMQLLESIGSTTQGVGFATYRKIMGRGDKLEPKVRLARDVPELRPFVKSSQQVLETAYVAGKRILLEGTQGTSLSLHHGQYPHVTSRDTTVAGCLADAGIAPRNLRKVIMVCRTYPIRVGGPSGYMFQEMDYDVLAARSKIPIEQLIKTEKTSTTNKQRRLGEFDWEQFQRSVFLNGPTDIALTFVDYISIKNRDAYRFEQLTPETVRFIEEIERVSGRPVSLISTDFNWRNIIDRRAW